ncbi:MAG TPA: hypothetical protein VGM23_06530, partial [Armatimonadota bacterium]
ASHPAVIQAMTAMMTAKAKVSGLEQALKSMAGQMKLLPEELMVDTKLAGDIEAHQAAAKFYRDALFRARLTSGNGQLYSVLDLPEKSAAPLSAARLLPLLAGLFGGLLLGLLIPVIAWHRWRPALVEEVTLPLSREDVPVADETPAQ